tara:strand:- start:6602 stop:7819 length:1218 start_codon:yes stop_codon:yes gene_type:complete
MLKQVKSLGAGLLIAQSFSIINQLIIGRFFMPESLGLYSLAIQLSAVVSLILFFRREYFIVEIKSKIQAFYYINYSLLKGVKRLIPLFLLALLINFYGKFFTIEVMIFSLLFGVLISYSISLQQIFNMKRAFFKSGMSEAVQKISFFVCLLVFSLMTFKSSIINFISLSFFIAVLIRIIYSLYFLKELKIPKYKNRKKYYSTFDEQTKKGFILSKNNGIAAITGLAPTLFIVNQFSSEDLGYFTMAITLLSLPTSLIGNSISQVLYEHLSSFKENRNLKEIKRLSFILVSTSLTFLFLYILGEKIIIGIALGEKWRSSLEIIYILIPSFMVSYISKPFERSCYLLGKQNWHVISAILKLILVMLAIFISFLTNSNFLFYVTAFSIATIIHYLIDFTYNYYLILKI